MLLRLGRPLLCLHEWLRARLQLAPGLMPYELSGGCAPAFTVWREDQRAQLILQRETHERNESTVFTFSRFRPLRQGRSPSLARPYFPSNTLSFSAFSASV